MSSLLKIPCFKSPFSSTESSSRFFSTSSISRVSTRFYFQKSRIFSSTDKFNLKRRLCSSTSNGDIRPVICPIFTTLPLSMMAQGENSRSQQTKTFTPNELMQRLRRYGISGVLSYGLLNTVYYFTMFLLVWCYVAPAPGKMGYAAAVKRFLEVMAMVWAGSQVTKIVRLGGALALAPFVDRGLSWFTVKFKFESQGKAFMAIVGVCYGLLLVLFFVVTLLWA